MDTILTPTDFSSNSKPGVRFAIRMAARSKAALVFIHIVPLKGDEQKAKVKLEGFISSLYQSMKLEPASISFAVVKGFSVDLSILEYLGHHPEVNYICIATRGASFLKKVVGTNTSNLIEKSPVPVLVIPKDYRVKALNSILYPTDLENFEYELQQLVDYARPKGFAIEVVHLSSPSSIDRQVILSEDWEAKLNYPLTIHIEKNDNVHPLYKNIQLQIKKRKPSMVCLFTHTNRSFFDKLFLPSLTENISYQADVPLLTFKKERKG